MLNTLDWKNIEMTGYYFGSPGSGTKNGSADVEHVMRGAWNNTSSEQSCSASNYHMNIYLRARDEVHLEKDQYHTNGYSKKSPKKARVGAGSALNGKWFGWKTVIWNNPDQSVTVEAYIDKGVSTDGSNPGIFQLVYRFTDKPDRMGTCRGGVGSCVEQDCQLPITYGGPILNFRYDNMDKMYFKWLSVREIQPGQSDLPDIIDSGQGFGNRYENEIYAYAGKKGTWQGKYSDMDITPAESSYGLAGYVKKRFHYGTYGYIDRYVQS